MDEEFDNDFRRWRSDLCPICKLERETQHRVMCCTSKGMERIRRKEDRTFSDQFDKKRIQ